ncbi:MAG: hypothetical protein A2268_01850 [Candidatus Raymondbacteria bacterium RifOxyA12_full_50_37]|uniref:GIY-YIG domain-containing protein n=1 Tax=Candidatus Raymondbacteria bacterium RIFOXYD12_FULL_49_13 TaxID=1817890 RepID=A0A1F7FHM4_UNCRA|nr:MAG: hypothetical protein A2268_01850 [Candidatus Raymondbacteria bacterium RifOxyA12_full_50_37]OGJ89312.1 MAG: hypothetical protein A2248_17470 [Candidatus Raymondbacteria bacterium RIFOXYA2_FULL_49_16]OGK00721.1 MAG: hypothetical protein A2350_18090 [Candidatus Raymondbacteria bacterium RifOxyB12_full_50_8]OGK04970.1 MAG: hypothetical protein A2487_15975 [Candidatus Raymondbacteria bacterium RifOxyC12_full_50_8]OGK06081.1 MAG: hypothetical protein A2519_06105 [Candidatus Raymondbacteria b
MFTVYVLFSDTAGKRYTGYTADLERRIQEHNDITAGSLGRFTLKNGPWRLVYHETGYATRKEAMKREKFLKSGQGRQYLDGILQ